MMTGRWYCWLVLLVSVMAGDMALAGNNSGQAFSTWPDTGQNKCYDNSQEIACPAAGQPFHGQDAQYQGPVRSYTDLGNGMVLDTVTGLIWEQKRNMDGTANYNDPRDADNTYTWCDTNADTNGGFQGICGDHDTQDYISQLNGASFGGHQDWRLPTIKELTTLVDSSRYRPSINLVFFSTTQSSSFYWSSTSNASGLAWGVSFGDGYEYYGKKYSSQYVRAVRGGEPQPVERFVDNGNGTVFDTVTCLQWQKATMDINNDGSPDPLSWQQALAAAEGLTLAGWSDWRLPDKNELRSLVDHSRYNPAIDPVFATTIQWRYYWSSTPHAEYTTYAWLADFSYGDYYFASMGNDRHPFGGGLYVRAVRGKQCEGFGINPSVRSHLPAISFLLLKN